MYLLTVYSLVHCVRTTTLSASYVQNTVTNYKQRPAILRTPVHLLGELRVSVLQVCMRVP